MADEYAYFGETTMAALGVSRPSGRPPPDANRIGTIWITADRRFNEGEPTGMAEGRMLCIEFREDGGEIKDKRDDQLSGRRLVAASRLARQPRLAAPVAWQLLMVGLGVGLLVAASLIAFRKRR